MIPPVEHRTEKLLPARRYAMRQLLFALVSIGVIVLSLGIGTIGYGLIEHERWDHAVYDAAMILTGMGPAIQPTTSAGRWFVTLYALFSGIVFLSAASILIAPAFHRLLHWLHLEDRDEGGRRRRSG